MTGAGDTPKVFSLRDNKNRDPAGHSGQHRVWTIGGRGSFIDHTDCCRPTSGSGSNTWSQPARRPAHQTSRSYPGVEKVARKSALAPPPRAREWPESAARHARQQSYRLGLEVLGVRVTETGPGKTQAQPPLEVWPSAVL